MLNMEDPIYKSVPSPLKAVVKFAAVCIYITKNGSDGALRWALGSSVNGFFDLPLAILFGAQIPLDTSTKRLLSTSRFSMHAIRFFPNVQLCLKFDAESELFQNRRRNVYDRGSLRANMFAIQSWAVALALVMFLTSFF